MEVNSLHHLIVWRLAAIDWSISDSSSSTLWFLASIDCRSRALMLWNYKENSTCQKITFQYVVCIEKINLLTIGNRIPSDGVTIQIKPLPQYIHIALFFLYNFYEMKLGVFSEFLLEVLLMSLTFFPCMYSYPSYLHSCERTNNSRSCFLKMRSVISGPK